MAPAEQLDPNAQHILPMANPNRSTTIAPAQENGVPLTTAEARQRELAAQRRLENVNTTEVGEYDWPEELDNNLYQRLCRIAVRGFGLDLTNKDNLTKSLGKFGADKELATMAKMLQEIMLRAQERDGKSETHFQSPAEQQTALAILYQHEYLVANALAARVTNNGQREAVITLPPQISVDTGRQGQSAHGFGLWNPHLRNIFRSIGVLVQGGEPGIGGFFQGQPAENLQVRIRFEQTGARVINTKYIEGFNITDQTAGTALVELQTIDMLRVQIMEQFHLNPAVEAELAMMALDTAAGGKSVLVNEIVRAKQRLAQEKGKTYDQLTPEERMTVDLQAVQEAAELTCEEVAQKVKTTETTTTKGKREAELAQINDQIAALESGSRNKEDVSAQIETLTQEKEALAREIAQLTTIQGAVDTEGHTTTEGTIVTAAAEYRTAVNQLSETTVQYDVASEAIDIANPNSRLSEINTELGPLVKTRGQLIKRLGSLSVENTGYNRKIEELQEALRKADPVDAQNIENIKGELKTTEIKQSSVSSSLTQTERLYTVTDNRITALNAEIAQLKTEQRTTKAAHDAAVANEDQKKRRLEALLQPFGQTLANVDNNNARNVFLATKQAELRAKDKELQKQQGKLEGKATGEDKREAGQLRAVAAINANADTYNNVVGQIDQAMVERIGQKTAVTPDLESSHKAVLEAVFDAISYKVPKEGRGEAIKYLTLAEQQELLNQGEIVQLAMEYYRLRPDQVLTGLNLGGFNANLAAIRNFEDGMAILKTARPANWRETVAASEKLRKDKLTENENLLYDKLAMVLPLISRNVPSAQDFSRFCIAYVREKAAAGQTYGLYRKYEAVQPAEKAYRVEKEQPKTNYGQAEFHNRGEIGRDGLRRLNDQVNYFYTTRDGVNYTLDLTLQTVWENRQRHHEVAGNVSLRRDISLYNQLPATRPPLHEIPDQLRDLAYDAAGNKIPLEEFANNDFLVVYSPRFDNFVQITDALANPTYTDLFTRNSHLSEVFPAAVTQMVLAMPEAQRREIIGSFPSASRYELPAIARSGTGTTQASQEIAINFENQELSVIWRDPAGQNHHEPFTEYIRNYPNLHRQRLQASGNLAAGAALTPTQLTQMENQLQALNASVGKQLLAAIQSRSERRT